MHQNISQHTVCVCVCVCVQPACCAPLLSDLPVLVCHGALQSVLDVRNVGRQTAMNELIL